VTAPARAEVLNGLHHILDVLLTHPDLPAPSPVWAIEFRAQDEEQAALIAASLGMAGCARHDSFDEDGTPVMELAGKAGVWRVRITADTGPALLDELDDDDPSLIGAAR
jgi:hypothetical protein